MIYICIILSVICVCLLIKLVFLKHEMRDISNQMRVSGVNENEGRLQGGATEKVECGHHKVTVDSFDKDVCGMANAINDLIEEMHTLNRKYLEDRDSLNKIISGISHDFRTPLTASLGYLQMLEKEPGLSEDAREYIKIVKEKNSLLKEFSDDFFEVTKLQNSDFEIAVEKVNISRLLSESLIIQNDWLEAKNIDCGFDIAEGVFCSCSPVYFERIIENLMSNASKYTKSYMKVCLIPEGKERFSLTVENDTDVHFENKEELQKIFEPFYRTASRNGSGTGLGLYVVRLLAEKMGMQVSAAFEEREAGNYFSITLKA